ncbi:inactive serine protease 54 isoform X1 [Ochotona princeps]|uniref:inactive serine protease 54 isoform X1 n=1 Tax=Ochotona princeps TaxID=9978 RepID=UPI0027149452|nr:inactive serine protease 54 isoform X1 [Ochotona princeps]XP_058530932.1 inactive serine protease 54 isoform X1 [Ochotona princeps]
MAELRGVLLLLFSVSLSSAADCGIQKSSFTDKSEENVVSSTEFPWVVSVQDTHYAHLAFGCILSEFWILSIASVLQNRPDIIIVVGLGNMDSRRTTHTEYPINSIIVHEDFDNYSMNNNIALLKTDSEISFNELVQSICFLGRKLHLPPVLKNCWVSGWNPTSATGNQMTMSILRKISVKDIERCFSRKLRKTGCGRHIEQETEAVCLGEPGNPVMCQLQQSDLWVLRGLLTEGVEPCPGLFLYIRVEDYSDWITFKTRRVGPPLSSLHHWEELMPHPHRQSQHDLIVTQSVRTQLDHVMWSQGETTTHLLPTNSSRDSLDFREKNPGESDSSDQAAYYDYYAEAGQGGYAAGQNRLHQPQEMISVLFVLAFFWSGV